MSIEKLRPSFNPIENRLAELRAVVPEAFSDGVINWDALREVFGAFVENDGEGAEHFGLSWPGKRQARRLAAQQSKGTLVPVSGEGINESVARNIFIEGDNLEVLKLLQKSYAGKVKFIYIDPPYNTGQDFIYNDDYQESLRKYLEITGQADADGKLLRTNVEGSGRYHSNWLNMMYPRLLVARQFLHEEGFIAVSIDDHELHHLRILLNDVFGEENYRNTILVRRYDKNINRQFLDRGLATLNVGAEYIMIFSRSSLSTLNPVYRTASEQRQNNGYWKGFWNAADRPTMRYDLLGVTPKLGQWKWKESVAQQAVANYKEYIAHYALTMSLEEHWLQSGSVKKFIRRVNTGKGKNEGVDHWIPPASGILRSSNWTDILASGTLAEHNLSFSNPKSVNVLKELIRLCSDDADLILDFFAGSCTTAEAVLQLNHEGESDRQFICVQLPEITEDADWPVITEISKERIRRSLSQIHHDSKIRLDLKNNGLSQNPGFRVYKLDRSNYKRWQDYQGESVEEIETFFDRIETPLVDDWKPENVLTEVLLLQGFPLDSTVTIEVDFKHNCIQRVESDAVGHRLFVCLDERISDATIERIDLASEDVFVCLDSALTDEAKLRLADRCTLRVI